MQSRIDVIFGGIKMSQSTFNQHYKESKLFARFMAQTLGVDDYTIQEWELQARAQVARSTI